MELAGFVKTLSMISESVHVPSTGNTYLSAFRKQIVEVHTVGRSGTAPTSKAMLKRQKDRQASRHEIEAAR